MSTEFKSKEEAFSHLFGLADRSDLQNLTVEDLLKHPDITKSTKVLLDWGGTELPDQTLVEFKAVNGEMVGVGSARFRDGFDAWIVLPTGFCKRL